MKTWKKILYEDQSEWQDNYIHKATFLKLKQINGNFSLSRINNLTITRLFSI